MKLFIIRSCFAGIRSCFAGIRIFRHVLLRSSWGKLKVEEGVKLTRIGQHYLKICTLPVIVRLRKPSSVTSYTSHT